MLQIKFVANYRLRPRSNCYLITIYQPMTSYPDISLATPPAIFFSNRTVVDLKQVTR